MRAFIKKYVDGCDTCVRKKHRQHPRSTTVPLDVPHGPWEEVGVDLITQLPDAHGKDAIIVFTDLFGKMIHAIACTSNITSEGAADIYYAEIFRLHGLPLRFVSDRGPQFASQLMRALLRRLGIKSNLTTAYHPQSNGQTERANQEVEKFLRIYTSRRQDDWDLFLPTAEFVLNSRTHSAHGRAPFEVLYGYIPLFNIPVGERTGIRGVDERIANLEEVRRDVEVALQLGKERQKRAHESDRRRSADVFKVGDFVFLDHRNLAVKVPSRKLGDTQLGPYKIRARVGELAYTLELPDSLSRIHPTFHVDLLTPWKGNDVNGILPPPPPPVELDDETEWEVQEVLDSAWVGRGKKKHLQYLVSWRGFLPRDNSWQPAENLEHSAELVKEFHERHPKAPAPAPPKPPRASRAKA